MDSWESRNDGERWGNEEEKCRGDREEAGKEWSVGEGE